MSNQKKTLKPLSRPSVTVPDGSSDFITGANTERLPQGEFPWEAPHVKKNNIKIVNLRLTEPMKLRLEFIAQNTHFSQHLFLKHHLEIIIKEECELLIREGHRPGEDEDDD